jgi:hypothetical protein
MAGINKVCVCGRPFTTTMAEIRKGGGKFCSTECYHKSRRGKRSPNWKGGRKKTVHGYIELYDPNHPHSDTNGYVKEHIAVVTKHIGRSLEGNEVVHHVNGIRDDNRLINLELMDKADHIAMHMKNHVRSKEHCAAISMAKKNIAHLIRRNKMGQFIGGTNGK